MNFDIPRIDNNIEYGRSALIQLDLQSACLHNRLDIVKYILHHETAQNLYDIHHDDDIYIYSAAIKNHWEVLHFLLTDPQVYSQWRYCPIRNPRTSLSELVYKCYVENDRVVEYAMMMSQHIQPAQSPEETTIIL